jgi:uncharacterized membrane protein
MSTQQRDFDLDISSGQQHREQARTRNHGRWERAESWGSMLGGTALAVFGVSRRSWPGAAVAAAGGYLIYHGVSSRRAVQAVDVRVSFTVNKPVEEVWRFWRNFANLPKFMTHLQTVQPTTAQYSYWTARAPMGTTVSWYAEILEEREHEYLVWQSLPGSDVHNRGSVEFRRAPGNRGTEIHVMLEYQPPGGRLGAAVASLFGESAEQQVREDLRHFKQLMEAGEIPMTEGQPHGRRSLMAKAVQRVSREPKEPVTMERTA